HADGLELEAVRRATEGDADYVVQGGRVVYMKDPETDQYATDPLTGEKVPVVRRNRSDRLLERLLEAKRPEQYRQNVKVDHQVQGGVLLVGQVGEASQRGKQLGLTYEEEPERNQAKYRTKDVIEGEVVKG